ncbi:MAG: hypothetical protein WB992_05640 [Bryobacteraceae bacterium]
MFLDPDKLLEAPPAEILCEAACGHLGLDHRFLHALLDRPAESQSAAVAFARRDRSNDLIDLAPELIALFRYWKAPEGIPFLIDYIKEDPDDVPDEVIETLVEMGSPALEPLLAAYEELPEAEREEVGFVLEHVRAPSEEAEPFDIWSLYPERADLPVDLLDESERAKLLDHPVASMRAAAANSFFNRELGGGERKKLLMLARADESASVRARAWEALTNSTEDAEVVEAMLAAMRNPELPVEERGGLLVGLAPEADRNQVREAIAELYKLPEGRAKALEAMWRSMHPSFHDYFARHLDDPDLEVRRGAVWGVGYFGVKGELERLRKMFDDEDLRSDALFAYALTIPGESTRGRMKGLLARIEKDARGLSEMEEELVKTALDERLILAGKEPVFLQQED